MVTKFVSVHNHELKKKVSITNQYRSHNYIDDGTKSIVQGLVDNEMPPTGMYGLLSGIHGGHGLGPFSRRVVNRLAYSIRRDDCADDIEKTLEYFQELQSRSKNLYYTMQTDGAGRIKIYFGRMHCRDLVLSTLVMLLRLIQHIRQICITCLLVFLLG